jgi:hypothetical protein
MKHCLVSITSTRKKAHLSLILSSVFSAGPKTFKTGERGVLNGKSSQPSQILSLLTLVSVLSPMTD